MMIIFIRFDVNNYNNSNQLLKNQLKNVNDYKNNNLYLIINNFYNKNNS